MFWSRLIGRAYVDPQSVVITEEAIASLSAEIATKAQVLPLYQVGEALTVARSRPDDVKLPASIAKIVQTPIEIADWGPQGLAERTALRRMRASHP